MIRTDSVETLERAGISTRTTRHVLPSNFGKNARRMPIWPKRTDFSGFWCRNLWYSQSPSMSHPVERQMSVPLPVCEHQNTTIVDSKWGCSSDLWDLVDRNPETSFPDLIWVGSSRRLLLGHALLRTLHLTVVECAACLYRQRLVVTAPFSFADTILSAFSPP